MAYVYSAITNTVIGNQRLVVFNISPDAAEANIGTSYHGLTRITAVLGVVKQSGVTHIGCMVVKINSDSSGVASAGCLGFSSVAGAVSQIVQVSVIGT